MVILESNYSVVHEKREKERERWQEGKRDDMKTYD